MHSKLIKLLDEYYEITKIMHSAIKARHLEIFENQVEIRAKCLEQISAEEKTEDLKLKSKGIMNKIKELEIEIEEESIEFKKELELENSNAKIEFSTMKKSNDVSRKYKYAGANQHRSSYIDQKK